MCTNEIFQVTFRAIHPARLELVSSILTTSNLHVTRPFRRDRKFVYYTYFFQFYKKKARKRGKKRKKKKQFARRPLWGQRTSSSRDWRWILVSRDRVVGFVADVSICRAFPSCPQLSYKSSASFIPPASNVNTCESQRRSSFSRRYILYQCAHHRELYHYRSLSREEEKQRGRYKDNNVFGEEWHSRSRPPQYELHRRLKLVRGKKKKKKQVQTSGCRRCRDLHIKWVGIYNGRSRAVPSNIRDK